MSVHQEASLIGEFLAWVSSQSSPSSYKAKSQDLKLWQAHFTGLSQFNDKEKLLNAAHALRERYQPRTAARIWSSWREFARYGLVQGLFRRAIIFELKSVSFNRDRQLEEKIRLNDLIDFCERIQNTKHRALFWFLLSTGLRVSELEQEGILRNLDLASREFALPSGRVAFLCQRAAATLAEYLAVHPLPLASSAIFLEEQSEQPMKAFTVYQLLKSYSKKLGLALTASSFRDCLALAMLREGASAEEIRFFLGFKSLKSLEPLLRVVL